MHSTVWKIKRPATKIAYEKCQRHIRTQMHKYRPKRMTLTEWIWLNDEWMKTQINSNIIIVVPHQSSQSEILHKTNDFICEFFVYCLFDSHRTTSLRRRPRWDFFTFLLFYIRILIIFDSFNFSSGLLCGFFFSSLLFSNVTFIWWIYSLFSCRLSNNYFFFIFFILLLMHINSFSSSYSSLSQSTTTNNSQLLLWLALAC